MCPVPQLLTYWIKCWPLTLMKGLLWKRLWPTHTWSSIMTQMMRCDYRGLLASYCVMSLFFCSLWQMNHSLLKQNLMIYPKKNWSVCNLMVGRLENCNWMKFYFCSVDMIYEETQKRLNVSFFRSPWGRTRAPAFIFTYFKVDDFFWVIPVWPAQQLTAPLSVSFAAGKIKHWPYPLCP